ncbi:hypothetical protein A2635_01240 [Candidatus Peribacteria bacterium RIFCSPHIGHO2_01_FULL_51_9]|nr:MAG: hypothetical protein A2635_01240 [Candidatus Peribacteria bacterium RIFCSPHIGHO2_01_FULL_51_9]
MVTIIIPAYNEENGIRDVLCNLQKGLSAHHIEAKITVVDDGSTDHTAQTVQNIPGITLIRHPYNKGYGAALKTGVEAADTEWCMTYDADGQHTPDLIPLLLKEMNALNHMVVGKREGYKGPWIRQPGKRLIHIVANYLVERRIPDLNSGLRAFRRNIFLRYAHLFPNGFSLSTTSTVCFFKENLNIAYVPIRIQKRTGKSTVRPNDFIKTLMLIVRLTMLFSPLRIFLPLSILLGLATACWVGYGIVVQQNISDSAVILIALTTLTFFFGLLADQIAAIRREQHAHHSSS